ncbi:MAG TPA: hypothetical protein VK534_02495 [Methylomirabilota bacterium]|nr:hypothetical protein [Methylomirabilota bacterium]
MSEQVPTGSLGGESVELSAVWQGMSVADIEEAVKIDGKAPDVYLGSVNGASPDYETLQADWTEEVDELLRLFEIKPDEWSGRVISAYSSHWDEKDIPIKKVQQEAAGLSLARFVLGRAYRVAPIETDDDGYGSANVVVKLNEIASVNIHSDYSFWAERTYLHPLTGERLYSGIDDDPTIENLKKDGHAMDSIESEIGSEISLYAYLRGLNSQDYS